MDLIRRKILATGAVATAMAAVRRVFAQQPSVAFENCVDEFPSSQRRGGAKPGWSVRRNPGRAGLTTPSAPLSVASRHLIGGASSPPLRGGECGSAEP